MPALVDDLDAQSVGDVGVPHAAHDVGEPFLRPHRTVVQCQRLLVGGACVGEALRTEVLEGPARAVWTASFARITVDDGVEFDQRGGVVARLREDFCVAEPVGHRSFAHSLLDPGGTTCELLPAMVVMLEVEPRVEVGEHVAQVLDLVVAVGRGDLDPEADFVLRHQGVRGHRHVDAAVEEEATDLVDVLVAGERYLDHGVTRLVRRVDAELVEAAENVVGLAVHLVARRGRRACR